MRMSRPGQRWIGGAGTGGAGNGGDQPASTSAGEYLRASASSSIRRVGLVTAPGPLVPYSTNRAEDGSYQMRAPVESTDDMRSHPFVPM